MKDRKCNYCGKFKDLKEFEQKYRSKQDKKKIYIGSSSTCRKCINKKNTERKKEIRREFSARGLYKGINKGRYKKTFTREEFLEWFEKLKNHNCEYCGISHQDYFKKKVYLKYTGIKTWLRFTLDRKNSLANYSLKNICICCPLCNYVKGYVFSYDDYKQIAKQYITTLYK